MSQLKLTAGGNIRMLGVILFAMAILCTSASSELSAYDWIKEKINGIFPGNSNTDKDTSSGASRENLEVKSVTTGSSSQSESSMSNDMLVLCFRSRQK